MKKGLNKPYFNQNERLSFLNHLSIIDYVFCNDAKDASNIISLIKPDFFVKGPDYKTKTGDEAGNLGIELKAINKVNGKFITTSNAQFSSTNLINKKLIFNYIKENNWLNKIKAKSKKDNFLDEYNKVLKRLRIKKLILGEVIFGIIIL